MTPAEPRQLLRDSGLFDAAWYAAAHPDAGHAGGDALQHYAEIGWTQLRPPNFYLDPAWYRANNPDVREAGIDPLQHYIMHGDAEGRAPGPYFDPAWYRAWHALAPEQPALAHYLVARATGASPLAEFDAGFYLATYRDVARAGADPFEHYVTLGWREGREPHPDFDSRYYARQHMGTPPGAMPAEAPLLHYLRHRHEPGVHPALPQEMPTIPREVRRNTRPSRSFELPQPLPDGAVPRAQVLAYYLPQFHAIAENDRWWGTGFTEWTNLARALPRFVGHYQPRIPRDLGHYQLTDPAVMRRQIALAKGGGVHGFVFYWYWFNGQRLLEGPVEAFLADRSLDMPFALMWANENWTRRWDGAEADVLMSQDYRPAEEAALIASFARHFADPRYIRLGGRPLLMVYRAGLIPDARATVAGWRRRFREAHGEDPIFVMAQSFEDIDPRPLGFDGAVEFPPHKLGQRVPPISAMLDYLDADFTGTVLAFDDIARASLEEAEPPFPLIKCAIPGWDNDARRQGVNSVIVHGASPASYQAWLAELVARAAAKPFHGTPLVCINAWNEWCEGAYLEPDLHHGAAFLNATGRAVLGVADRDAPALLLGAAGTEEAPAAARLLEAVQALRRLSGLRVEVLLLEGGALEAPLAALGPVTLAQGAAGVEGALAAARDGGVRHALLTTEAASRLAGPAAAQGMDVTLLVQDMPGALGLRGLLPGLRAALTHAARALVPSEAAKAALEAECGAAVTVLEPGLAALPAPDAAGAARRTALGIGAAKLLLGAGPGDLRHGFDLFLQAFRRLQARVPGLRALWAGPLDPALRGWLAAELAAARQAGLLLQEEAPDAALLAAADVLALTAREDALPALAQQAVAAGLPMAAFAGAGGAAALAEDFGGRAVLLGDAEAMAEACAALLAAPRPDAAAAHAAAAARFAPNRAAAALLAALLPDLPAVAVAVPGHGQGGLLASRLDAVFGQDLPVRAVVLMDDATDSRVAEGAGRAAARWQREFTGVTAPATAGATAEAALAASPAALLWLADPALAPGADFLRLAAATLQAAPDAPFAQAGAAEEIGAVLWRREALAAAVAMLGPAADGPALLRHAASLGSPARLPGLTLRRLPGLHPASQPSVAAKRRRTR